LVEHRKKGAGCQEGTLDRANPLRGFIGLFLLHGKVVIQVVISFRNIQSEKILLATKFGHVEKFEIY